MSNFFGYHLLFDCSGCDVNQLKNYNTCNSFIKELVSTINMVPFGEPIIEYMLDSKEKQGYSIVQLLTTSSIVCHLLDSHGTAYIDIFSCKEFDIDKAQQTIVKYFSPSKTRVNLITRDAG